MKRTEIKSLLAEVSRALDAEAGCDCNEAIQGWDYWTTEGLPEHPYADWKAEVANNDTRYGYWAWVKHRMEDN